MLPKSQQIRRSLSAIRSAAAAQFIAPKRSISLVL